MPGKYDAVIMIEDIEENNDGSITIIKSVSSFENVRPIGEDIVLGELVLPKYHRIKPIDISHSNAIRKAAAHANGLKKAAGNNMAIKMEKCA